jgi:hypothetical protein
MIKGAGSYEVVQTARVVIVMRVRTALRLNLPSPRTATEEQALIRAIGDAHSNSDTPTVTPPPGDVPLIGDGNE